MTFMPGYNDLENLFRPMTPDRSHAERLQDLFIRLLFCDAVFDRYCADISALIRDFGLEEADRAHLPDPNSAQLQAERHGRKIGVRREVIEVFAQSFELIEALPGFDFQDFLGSREFFGDQHSLPHPFGTGPAYESASKFFFWARNNVDFAATEGGEQARNMSNGDFAAYLIGQFEQGSTAYFDRFASGIYWREFASTELPMILMTAERNVYRIADPAGHEKALATGAIDLNRLRPEPPPPLENLI